MSNAFELGRKLGNALIRAFHKTHEASQTIFEKSGAWKPDFSLYILSSVATVNQSIEALEAISHQFLLV